jgi:serine/threonine-protein kinase
LDPPLTVPGEVMLFLDTEGRLRSFRAIPLARDSAETPTSPVDWSVLFSAAGLNIADWKSTEPKVFPESFADTRAAWEGTLSDAPGVPIRVEAAALQGRPVNFRVLYPWMLLEEESTQSAFETFGYVLLTALFVTLVIGPVFYARQNLRLGRGDRRGANRMTLALAVVPFTIFFLLFEHHVLGLWELVLFIMFIAGMMFFGGLLWTLYIAIEPFVRRRWPEVLVSWTRLLSGDWRDPLVGRDVLIGCAVGIASSVLVRLSVLTPLALGRPERGLLPFGNFGTLLGTSSFVGHEAFFVPFSGVIGLFGLFLFLFLRTLLRKDWLAGLVWILFMSYPDPSQVPAGGMVSALVFTAIGAVLLLFVQMRFGLLAAITSNIIFGIGNFIPMTLDTSWYAPYGLAGLLLTAGVAFFGFRISLGGLRLLNFSAIDNEAARS